MTVDHSISETRLWRFAEWLMHKRLRSCKWTRRWKTEGENRTSLQRADLASDVASSVASDDALLADDGA
jgi:hypothetical protein